MREQFLARVGFWNKATQPLPEHRADLALLGKTAAQNDIYVWIQYLKFIEHGIAIHNRKEEIEDNETDLLPDPLVDFQRFEPVVHLNDFVTFFSQQFGGIFCNFHFIFDEQKQFAIAFRIFNLDVGRNSRWRRRHFSP